MCPDWPPEYADQEGGRNSIDKRHNLALIRQVYIANHGATALHFPQTNRRVRDSCYHPPRAPITAERRVDAQASVRRTMAPTRPTKQRVRVLGKLCIAKNDKNLCRIKKLCFPFLFILVCCSPPPGNSAQLRTPTHASRCCNMMTVKDAHEDSWHYYVPPVFPSSFLLRNPKTWRGAGQNAYFREQLTIFG